MSKTVEGWLEDFNNLKDDLGDIPENTCPDIDKALSELSQLEKDMKYIEKNTHYYETAEDMAKDLPDIGWLDTPNILEGLRSDNEKLRELGRVWYGFSKDLIEFLLSYGSQCKAEGRKEAVEVLKNLIPKDEDITDVINDWIIPELVKSLTHPDNNNEQILTDMKEELKAKEM